MTVEMERLYAKRDELLNKVNTLMAQGKMGTEEATNLCEEAAKNEVAIANLEKVENLNKSNAKENVIDKTSNGFKIVMNAIKTGKFVNDLGTELKTGGLNGEDYLLPQDIQLAINEKKKEWLSAKELVNVESTFALKGSVNYGKDPTDGLISFEDGDEIDSSKLPSFEQVPFSIKWYGAIIPITNILTGAEQSGLMTFINIWFVRRAIISENTEIFKTFKAKYNSGTPKTIADETALRTSINTDLDPAYVSSADMVVVTNQDGFNYLDTIKDENKKYVLQPDPTNPTARLYKGYPLKVFSNSQLPTSADKIPFIYGATKQGVTFKEYENYFFDTDNGKGIGFTKNTTLLKVVEGFDVVGANTDAYVYAEMTKE